jgi:hypothetical protein
MLKFVKDCAPWFTWKIGATFAAIVLVAGIALGTKAGLLAFIGASPFLAIAACMLPCLIPLALLRRKK